MPSNADANGSTRYYRTSDETRRGVEWMGGKIKGKESKGTMNKPRPVPAIPSPQTLEAAPRPYILAACTPALLPITSGRELLEWYRNNLCSRSLIDPRGYRVIFLDTDFVHLLVKLIDKYGNEPRNRRMTVDQIRSGRVNLTAGRFDIRRAQELSWASSIIQQPTMIVPNWQIMGKANPGDAYIKNFGIDGGRPIYRVLICGHEGQRRRPVTIFPRERFTSQEIHPILWP